MSRIAKKSFDLLVIGAGSGGVRASRIAAGYNAKVGLIELQQNHGPPHYAAIGGTCVNVGCVPKKLMMYGAQFANNFELAKSYGWRRTEEVLQQPVDWGSFMQRKNHEISRLNGVYDRMLTSAGVELINGHGKLLDENTVQVGDDVYTADKILVSVGAWPFKPDIPGIEHTVSSNEMFYLDNVPERITIVGGGYIAVEFAGIMKGFGSEVTLLHRGDNLLRGFDLDLRKQLYSEMIREGIDVRLGTQPASITKQSDGSLTVESEPTLGQSLSPSESEISADVVMYATGRVPNVSGIGLENAGVELDSAGAIIVDHASRTTAPNGSVFAVGDVTNRMNLTPVALHEGHCFADTEFGGKERFPNYSNIPAAVFSSPPLATVGMTQEEAIATVDDVTVFKTSFRPMQNTLAAPLDSDGADGVIAAEKFYESKTLMKLVVDTKTDTVLGAHMLGPDAAEIIQGMAVAITAGATKQHFDSTIGIHPSAAEEFVTMRTAHSRFVHGEEQ